VNDLLEVSRITRGLIEVQREPIDLGFVVQSAIETSRPAIDAGDHQLTVDLPREPIIVRGDTIRLTQVFANLLNNAAKYTDARGHISVTLTREGAQAVVVVRDDGIGIPTQQLVSVFEMFTQVDRSNRLAQGGLGIGLTLVRSLVEMHGGQVEARSQGPGTGSEFVVSLPVAPGKLQRAVDAPGLADLPRRRILIVDDNTDAADMLGELLKALGASVLVVHSGREALDAVETFAPDVAVLDIGMPEMDGYEVARRIRARSPGRVPMLIALTGWGQECDQDRSRAAGFDHHMVKPLDVARLRELLMVPSATG
jgi:CheY-like chemotaxis protein/two-component sensor histidine kinase